MALGEQVTLVVQDEGRRLAARKAVDVVSVQCGILSDHRQYSDALC